MIDLMLEDGDISLDSTNDIAIVEDGDQVVSHVNARLKMILGEDYFDTQKGIPWFEGMHSLSMSYEQRAAILRQTILRTPEVASLNTFSYGINMDTKTTVVEYNASTIYETSIADTVAI